MEPILQEAADAVREGALIVFPTDTVYGIGCDPFSSTAVQSLFTAKKRPTGKTIPLLVDSITTAHAIADISPQCEVLLNTFWPGALTVVVPTTVSFPDGIIKNGTIAIRMPDHEDLLELIENVGGVLAATSANISGEDALLNYTDAYAQFKDVAKVILPGVVQTAEPSTIIDCTGNTPVVLREGPVHI